MKRLFVLVGQGRAIRPRRSGLRISLATAPIVLLVLLAGCSRPPSSDLLARPVDVVVTTAEDLRSISSITVVNATPNDRGDQAALVARAEDLLRRRGFAISNGEPADATLELAHRVERVRKRSWSSDPDASGTRLVERHESVLALRIVRREDGVERWRSEARTLLDVAPSDADAVARSFPRLLDAALGRLPERS